MLSRRTLLAAFGAASLARPALGAGADALLAMRDDPAGRHFVTRFDAEGRVAFDLTLPARGHGTALTADRSAAVAVARRPGHFLILFDPVTGKRDTAIESAPGFFFCGHAVFSQNGRLIYAAETRAEDAAGFIGVYDTRDAWRRVAAWPTEGGDPHELLLDGDTLVVANGGFGLDEGAGIDPSMVRLDARDGRVLEQVLPPDEFSQVSLRHIALADGAVFVAGQYAGPSGDRPPLVARWDRGSLRFLDLGSAPTAALANYCGSIATSLDGRRLCVASPRGNRAIVFTPEGRVLGQTTLVDGCGVAPLADGSFLITSGRGALRSTGGRQETQVADARWDNHAARI